MNTLRGHGKTCINGLSILTNIQVSPQRAKTHNGARKRSKCVIECNNNVTTSGAGSGVSSDWDGRLFVGGHNRYVVRMAISAPVWLELFS